MPRLRKSLPVLLCLAFASLQVHAAALLGAAALQSRHAALAPQLAQNAFGGPFQLQSQEAARQLQGEVHAVLDHPFERVAGALSEPGRWCDILILHLNTKQCRPVADGAGTRVELRVGRKEEQAPSAATLLGFQWQPPARRADYLAVSMLAPEGPYGTHDYQLLAEAVPLASGKTFLRMAYAFGYGSGSQLAMQLYLSTVGRDKVGFTPGAGPGEHVGGLRGVVERNTMRYFLAIDAYLDSLGLPPAQQLDQRLQAWFDATERYPRQLHELDRDAYLRIKRREVARQNAG